MTKEIAETLEEYATYLKLDGRDGKAMGVNRAANSILREKYLPPDPTDVDGVGESLRETVSDIRRTGTCEDLEHLKDKYSFYEELRGVQGIGPSTAKKLHYQARISTTEDLQAAIDSGDILSVDGIGPKTAEKFERNL